MQRPLQQINQSDTIWTDQQIKDWMRVVAALANQAQREKQFAEADLYRTVTNHQTARLRHSPHSLHALTKAELEQFAKRVPSLTRMEYPDLESRPVNAALKSIYLSQLKLITTATLQNLSPYIKLDISSSSGENETSSDYSDSSQDEEFSANADTVNGFDEDESLEGEKDSDTHRYQEGDLSPDTSEEDTDNDYLQEVVNQFADVMGMPEEKRLHPSKCDPVIVSILRYAVYEGFPARLTPQALMNFIFFTFELERKVNQLIKACIGKEAATVAAAFSQFKQSMTDLFGEEKEEYYQLQLHDLILLTKDGSIRIEGEMILEQIKNARAPQWHRCLEANIGNRLVKQGFFRLPEKTCITTLYGPFESTRPVARIEWYAAENAPFLCFVKSSLGVNAKGKLIETCLFEMALIHNAFIDLFELDAKLSRHDGVPCQEVERFVREKGTSKNAFNFKEWKLFSSSYGATWVGIGEYRSQAKLLARFKAVLDQFMKQKVYRIYQNENYLKFIEKLNHLHLLLGKEWTVTLDELFYIEDTPANQSRYQCMLELYVEAVAKQETVQLRRFQQIRFVLDAVLLMVCQGREQVSKKFVETVIAKALQELPVKSILLRLLHWMQDPYYQPLASQHWGMLVDRLNIPSLPLILQAGSAVIASVYQIAEQADDVRGAKFVVASSNCVMASINNQSAEWFVSGYLSASLGFNPVLIEEWLRCCYQSCWEAAESFDGLYSKLTDISRVSLVETIVAITGSDENVNELLTTNELLGLYLKKIKLSEFLKTFERFTANQAVDDQDAILKHFIWDNMEYQVDSPRLKIMLESFAGVSSPALKHFVNLLLRSGYDEVVRMACEMLRSEISLFLSEDPEWLIRSIMPQHAPARMERLSLLENWFAGTAQQVVIHELRFAVFIRWLNQQVGSLQERLTAHAADALVFSNVRRWLREKFQLPLADLPVVGANILSWEALLKWTCQAQDQQMLVMTDIMKECVADFTLRDLQRNFLRAFKVMDGDRLELLVNSLRYDLLRPLFLNKNLKIDFNIFFEQLSPLHFSQREPNFAITVFKFLLNVYKDYRKYRFDVTGRKYSNQWGRLFGEPYNAKEKAVEALMMTLAKGESLQDFMLNAKREGYYKALTEGRLGKLVKFFHSMEKETKPLFVTSLQRQP